MMYLVYRMKLSARARQNQKQFWAWLEERETFFYKDLPMVESVNWYYSAVGEVYVIENWAGFKDAAAWGEYRDTLATLKSDADWETERVSQDDWWEFMDTRMVVDVPVKVGFDKARGTSA